jgi:hypothetical protein
MGGTGSYSKSCLNTKIQAFPRASMTNNDITAIKNQCKSVGSSRSNSNKKEGFNGQRKVYEDTDVYYNTGGGWSSSSICLILIILIFLVIGYAVQNKKIKIE